MYCVEMVRLRHNDFNCLSQWNEATISGIIVIITIVGKAGRIVLLSDGSDRFSQQL